MPKPYSLDLRERVVGFVEDGHSRRAAAAHFKVSVSFVVNLVKAVRTRGSFEPQRRTAPRQARAASVVSFGAGRREGRHNHAGAGGRAAATGEKADPASLSRW